MRKDILGRVANGVREAGRASSSNLSRAERVSVIIPTFDRPKAVHEAVASVAQQTLPPLEVLVIDDNVEPTSGHDGPVLGRCHDGVPVRWIHSGGRVGGSAARNIGIDAAEGDFVAFCDDDDLWEPTKLERQCQAVRMLDPQLMGAHLVLCCVVRGEDGMKQPLVLPAEGQRLADYLFPRHAIGDRAPLVQTSTILVSASLARSVRFEASLAAHQDWDFALRCEAEGARITYVDEALARLRDSQVSVSRATRLDDSLAWATLRRELLGEEAYSAFCLGHCARVASETGDFEDLRTVLRAGLSGRWRVRHIARLPLYWIVNEEHRSMIRRWTSARRTRSA